MISEASVAILLPDEIDQENQEVVALTMTQYWQLSIFCEKVDQLPLDEITEVEVCF
jgi:hypothetical protein